MERHMTRIKRGDKKSIRYQQFQGGYAQVEDTQLRALLEGYRLGHFRRNEIRVFAARLEFAARHPNCKRLSLARVLNCDSQRKGNRRLSTSQITVAARKLGRFLPHLQVDFNTEWRRAGRTVQSKPVARKVLRHIARGGATTVEALFCFAYFMRRIPQRKPMQRLQPEERYARLRYAEFQQWTGVHRGTQSRMLPRLVERGFLNTVAVQKQNENAYGQLFVDGAMVSLVRPRQSASRRVKHGPASRHKTSTPRPEKVNTPLHARSTLRNIDPKTEIEQQERFVLALKTGYLGRHGDPELQRIATRAAQMAENACCQAA